MRTHHRKFVAVALILGITAAVALAANVHFINADAERDDNDLVVSFKIAGLGDNELITVTASCTATANYECINRGGNNPAAANKEQVIADLSVSGDFRSDKNGSVTGELTIEPPRGDSAVYLHARQADGHEVWTSPLFFSRDA